MAFSGVRIECYRGVTEMRDSWWSYLMPGKLEWSQGFAGASGTTSKDAVRTTVEGDPIFRVHSENGIYLAIGPNPDATVDGMRICHSGGSLVYRAAPGDKLAWVAA